MKLRYKKTKLVEFLEKGKKGKDKKESEKNSKTFLIITFWSNLSLNVVRCFSMAQTEI